MTDKDPIHTVTDEELTRTEELCALIRACAQGYHPAIAAAALLHELASGLAAEADSVDEAVSAFQRFVALGVLQIREQGVGPHRFAGGRVPPRRM